MYKFLFLFGLNLFHIAISFLFPFFFFLFLFSLTPLSLSLFPKKFELTLSLFSLKNSNSLSLSLSLRQAFQNFSQTSNAHNFLIRCPIDAYLVPLESSRQEENSEWWFVIRNGQILPENCPKSLIFVGFAIDLEDISLLLPSSVGFLLSLWLRL